jgi:two-component system chemotaxis response regulator CheY
LPKSYEQLRILHLAENPNAAKVLRDVLDVFDIQQIRQSRSPDEAYQMVQVFAFDLAIFEWCDMPKEAIELALKIRRDPDSPNPFLPIIMAVDRAEPGVIIDARDAGVNEIVARPMSLKALSSRMASIFENPRPFVRSDTYFGPCRRRKQVPFEGPDRRAKAWEI